MNTLLYENIYLSHLILERVVFFSVVCERWVERHILRERTSSSRNPGGGQSLHPLASSSETLLVGCVAVARPRFSALCLNPTAWFSSRGLLPVTHLFDFCDFTRRHLPVYKSKCDSLPKYMGSLGTNRKSMSYVI